MEVAVGVAARVGGARALEAEGEDVDAEEATRRQQPQLDAARVARARRVERCTRRAERAQRRLAWRSRRISCRAPSASATTPAARHATYRTAADATCVLPAPDAPRSTIACGVGSAASAWRSARSASAKTCATPRARHPPPLPPTPPRPTATRAPSPLVPQRRLGASGLTYSSTSRADVAEEGPVSEARLQPPQQRRRVRVG